MAIGSLIGAALGAGATIFGASQQKKAASKAAQASMNAAATQAAGIERGIADTEGYYNDAIGYLTPFIDMGTQQATQASSLLNDIIGQNGAAAQERALAMYQSSPMAKLLVDANAEAARQTSGQFAAGGMSRSGAMTTELAKRLSANNIAGYTNWQSLIGNQQTTGLNTGLGAASAAATTANNRGAQILGARSGQGAAQASGIIGAANANLAGSTAVNNTISYLGGRAMNTDWNNVFGKVGTAQQTNPQSWLNGQTVNNDFSYLMNQTPF